ncbi:Ribonuclease H-like protein [Ascosphaera apis ARSEF 7405]|uniref:Ribonuclease H-like protein n=1 Tax=Ascosphaera apis ARSEF 7405 TaxID=392613 RepID=A0A162HZG3_9EURO|nr:Ribonuclease H-like protein [Ascosphaera apis ARSEF 7405]
MVSQSFIATYQPAAVRTPTEAFPISGIASCLVSTETALLTLLIPARLKEGPVTCRIRVRARVVPVLRAGLLIGTDNMMPERMSVNMDTRRLEFKGHRGAEAPLRAVRKPHAHPPLTLLSADEVVVPPGCDYRVPFRIKGSGTTLLRKDRDYIFEPSHPQVSFYAAILAYDSQYVIAHNCTGRPYRLSRNTPLGTIQVVPLTEVYFGEGSHEAALEGGSQASQDTALHPSSEDPQELTPLGITVAGAPHERQRLTQVTEEFAAVWENDGKLVDIPEAYWMTVPLKAGAQFPKHARSYPYGPEARKEVDQTMDLLQASGKVSWSKTHTPSAYPLFVTYREVEKDGRLVRKPRVVVDIRKLNEITEPDVYPVQQQEDLLRRVARKRVLSVFDAASFFYQWRVHPHHRNRMAVISHRGQEVFNVAIMGYVNSIAYVGRQMANILRGCEDMCVVYVDDIIVFSDTFSDHIHHLRLIFNRLRAYRITLSPSKTFLGFTSVVILGQKVTSLGLTTTPERIRALLAWTFPANHKQLESYLGAVGFLRQFIPGYARIAKPLEDYKTLLLKESPALAGAKRRNFSLKRDLLEATDKERAAFEELQAILKQGLFLHHQDPALPLFINVDASKEYGFGAVLYHARSDWAGYRTQDYSTPPPKSKMLPILFLSRQLQGGELRFHPTDMELACIVWTLRKTKAFVDLSPRTVIYTDHVSNTYLAHQSVQQASMGGYNMRLTLGAILIRSFPNVEVRYIRGADNTLADALSRLPGAPGDDGIRSTTDPGTAALHGSPAGAAYAVTRSHARQSPPAQAPSAGGPPGSGPGQEPGDDDQGLPALVRLELPDATEDKSYSESEVTIDEDLKGRLIKGYEADPKWRAIIEQLHQARQRLGNNLPEYPYQLHEDDLLWQHYPQIRLCIPRSLEKEIFELCHTPAHLGYHRTLQRMQAYCIPRGSRKLKEFIAACPQCLSNRTRRHKPHGALQPILDPFIPFHTLCIDIVMGLPDGKYDAFMSVTDKATKRCTFIPGRTTWSAEDWGAALDTRLAEGDWGTPRKIISDRDPKFLASVWKTLWQQRQVKLAYTTAYHPQADGQSERTNQVAEIALRNWLPYLPSPYDWQLALPHIQAVLNSSVHSATQTSPHRLMYGMELPAAEGPFADPRLRGPGLGRVAINYDASIAVADAITAMVKHYDSRHKPVYFNEGDKVMLRLHRGYNIPSTRTFPKVSVQYAGPFEVKRRVTPLAYELALPANMKVHPVVSVAHLEPAPKEDPYARVPDPPGPIRLEDGTDDNYEIEAIQNVRLVRRGSRTIKVYTVRWKGYGPEADSEYLEDDLPNAKELIEEFEAARKADRRSKTALQRYIPQENR